MPEVIFSFEKKLAFSQGVMQADDISTLMDLITGCVSVVKTEIADDKSGIDYIATLRRGSTLGIDAKRREKGCSEYWQNGEPELAPEIWSVMPNGKYHIPRERAKAGWTLDESKKTDYIFCTFDPADTVSTYFLPFQLYRMAFIKNRAVWCEDYKVSIQDSRSWQSKCVFVPAAVVMNAIYEEMQHIQPSQSVLFE